MSMLLEQVDAGDEAKSRCRHQHRACAGIIAGRPGLFVVRHILRRGANRSRWLIDPSMAEPPVECVSRVSELTLDIFQIEQSGTVGKFVEHPGWYKLGMGLGIFGFRRRINARTTIRRCVHCLSPPSEQPYLLAKEQRAAIEQ